ncbi:unnamed protein product, partial [Symbiodinium necroappetens]
DGDLRQLKRELLLAWDPARLHELDDDAGNELRDDEDYDQLLDAEDGEEEGGEEPVAWAAPALEPENADEEQEEGGIEEEEPQEEENEEEETQEEAAVVEMGEDAGGDEAGGVCADVERKAGELEMVDDARGEADEAHEEEEGREEVLIVPETPAAAVGQPRSEPDGIIEIEATPSPKRLNAAAVARQDSCPKIDAPPPTRLQILTAMYAKLKTLDCITRSAIHVTHVHCSAEDMLRFTDMSYIRREQQARKDREAGVAISKDSKGILMDNVETQTYDADGTAEALTTNYMEIQDSDDEGLGAPEPLRPPPVEEQGQVELPPKARAEVKQILAEDASTKLQKYLGEAKDGEERTIATEDVSGSGTASSSIKDETGIKDSSSKEDKPKTKGKGKGKKAKNGKARSTGDEGAASSSAGRKPKTKGKGTGKKAEDGEDRSALDEEPSSGSKRKAQAHEEVASKRGKVKADRPPVPTYKHAELSVYWTRAGVGVKCKLGEDKGKQAKLLDDAEACVTPPLLEAMN